MCFDDLKKLLSRKVVECAIKKRKTGDNGVSGDGLV